MTQQFRVLATLAEDPGLISSIYMTVHNHLQLSLLDPVLGNPKPSCGLCGHRIHMCTDIQTGKQKNPKTLKKKKKLIGQKHTQINMD